jgi:hypothetical protein
MDNNCKRFERNTKAPNCIGALDGKHIRLTNPDHAGSLYRNYKNVISLVLMAMCDANYCFVWVDTGAYGKTSYSGIFHHSTSYKKLTQQTQNVPAARPVITENDAIRSSSWWSVWFDGELNASVWCKVIIIWQSVFNFRLTLARRYIECTFGTMCNKWRILHRPLDVHIAFAENIFKAICVLYNYARMRNGYNYEDTLHTAPLPRGYRTRCTSCRCCSSSVYELFY